jgi:hypothetical protein
MYLRKADCEGGKLLELTQVRVQWRAYGISGVDLPSYIVLELVSWTLRKEDFRGCLSEIVSFEGYKQTNKQTNQPTN